MASYINQLKAEAQRRDRIRQGLEAAPEGQWGNWSISDRDNPILWSTMTSQTNDMTDTTYNGWTNYETWNAALWIGNDEFLYNTAKACVTYRVGLETPWDKFVRCMTDGQIGPHARQDRRRRALG